MDLILYSLLKKYADKVASKEKIQEYLTDLTIPEEYATALEDFSDVADWITNHPELEPVELGEREAYEDLYEFEVIDAIPQGGG